eukprot:TRINITY_DN22209_c1_g4_i1.p1 TRINITY_DN22209_c1_g4~~TRINITY_DN22209_c1_g4_i1.p1  ORF type:complete len:425 (+),score=107.13 TRINITY_DN22209_c1_g4_i1:74-1348(+)
MKAATTFCLTLLASAPSAAGITVQQDRHRSNFLSSIKREFAESSLNSTAEELQAMSQLYPFYHTSSNIRSELEALAARCPGMTLKKIEKTGVSGRSQTIDVVSIRGPGDAAPVNRNFLLFGEHARELISAESGLHFVKTLCGETDLAEEAQKVLKNSEFQIVVNGNPGSRSRVEEGDFCLRVDPNGVDLNRNWDEKWQPAAVMDPDDTNPGPEPFSEPETRIFKELVESFKPTTFLTIHSGTKGMYMPWAFDMEHLADRNEHQMMTILRDLDKDHCQCPFGAAGREVGYSCPGTCLDWVYEQLQTPYAFAFEIYVGEDQAVSLRERWEEKMKDPEAALIQRDYHLGDKSFHDVFEQHPSNFVQMSSKRNHHRRLERSAVECFEQFNPGSADELKSVVNNWSKAYLDMADMVAANLQAASAKATI